MTILPRLVGPKRTAIQLVFVVVTMASLSYAAVPFYNWFCRTTGFGGKPLVASTGSDVILDQTVVIRFDASLDAGMPWQFKPQFNTMTLRIGETALVNFEAYNPTDRVVAATASYNVTPDQAGAFFNKIECFCFKRQVLKPGERALMPVSFFIDPAMVTDAEGQYIKEITLSYTLYETALPEEQAALAPATTGAVN